MATVTLSATLPRLADNAALHAVAPDARERLTAALAALTQEN